MQDEIKLTTENGFKSINPTIIDIENAVAFLNSKTNTLILLKINDDFYCQAKLIHEDSFQIEIKISFEELYVTKKLYSKLQLIAVLESVLKGSKKWRSVCKWQKKEFDIYKNKFSLLALIGFLALILEIVLLNNYNYKGSGLKVGKNDIEVVYLGLVFLWLIMPYFSQEIVIFKKISNSKNIELDWYDYKYLGGHIIAIIFIVVITILILFDSLLTLLFVVI